MTWKDGEVVQPGTAGHPDLWTRWCVPRGCLMLVSSCQGWEELSHPMGKGCAGVLEQGGSQLPWEEGGDLGGRGATLVGPKCFGGRGVSTEVLPGVG